MTDNATAAAPQATTEPAPVTARRYTESVSLFVDPFTRAYTLGRAIELQREHGWTTPRESEVLRAILDEAIDRHRGTSAAEVGRLVQIGYAEMDDRASRKSQ